MPRLTRIAGDPFLESVPRAAYNKYHSHVPEETVPFAATALRSEESDDEDEDVLVDDTAVDSNGPTGEQHLNGILHGLHPPDCLPYDPSTKLGQLRTFNHLFGQHGLYDLLVRTTDTGGMKFRYQPFVLDVGFLFPFLGFVLTEAKWEDDERLARILSEDVGPDATSRSRTVLLLSRLIRQRAVRERERAGAARRHPRAEPRRHPRRGRFSHLGPRPLRRSSGSDKQISQKDFRDEIVAELASGDAGVSTTIDLSSLGARQRCMCLCEGTCTHTSLKDWTKKHPADFCEENGSLRRPLKKLTICCPRSRSTSTKWRQMATSRTPTHHRRK